MQQCLKASFWETEDVGLLIGQLFMPRASQTVSKCCTTEQYSQPWNVSHYGFWSFCGTQWKGKARLWGFFFPINGYYEDSWGLTSASSSFKDSEKLQFHTPWCSLAFSCIWPRSGGMRMKPYLLWSNGNAVCGSHQEPSFPTPVPKL